jgi:hypothetical protein
MRKLGSRKIVVLAAVAAVLGVVLAATPAGAVNNWTNIWNNLKGKGDKRYVNESELLWAVVDGSTGTLDRGNGVISTN